jgi:hypothetical protein
VAAQLSADRKTILVRVTNVKESLGGGTANTKGEEQRLSVFDLLKGEGVLTEHELASLESADTGEDNGWLYWAIARSQEKGSTWQLHSDPFAPLA